MDSILLGFIIAPLLAVSMGLLPGQASLTEDEAMEILRAINHCRSTVSPIAANMQRVAWSSELARMAQGFAEQCVYRNNFERHSTFSYSHVGETISITPVRKPNLTSLVESWNSQSPFYDYEQNKCNSLYPPPGCRCMNYLQVIHAGASHIGCGAHRCSKVDGYGLPNAYLLVCNYGPGMEFKLSKNHVVSQRPYLRAQFNPCTRCPSKMPICVNNLCTPEQSFSVGSDPHFSVLLPGGERLCFSTHGEPGKTFNLLSNHLLQMNARFVPAPKYPGHTYLGAVGVNCFKKIPIHVTFTASNEMIQTSRGLEIDAREIVAIVFNGSEIILTAADKERTNYHWWAHHKIDVEMTDMNLKFSVWIIKSLYINLVWHSPGHLITSDSHGLIGQFFHDDVEINVETKTLHLPGQRSIPVTRHKPWGFMKEKTRCWAPPPTTNPQGLFEYNVDDFEVENLIITKTD